MKKAIVAISDADLRGRVADALGRFGWDVSLAWDEAMALIQMRANPDASLYVIDWNLMPVNAFGLIRIIGKSCPDAKVWVTAMRPLDEPDRSLFEKLGADRFHLAIELVDQIRRSQSIK